MRKLLTILFLFITSCTFAIDKYWVGGGSSTNVNATGNTNWALTSGGVGNQAVPSVSDNVFFDANGNSAAVISATITFLSLTISSGYTSTITHNAVLTIAGNVTFVTGYTIAGASGITISATSTITSNTKTFPNAVTFSTAATTKTLADNWTIGGQLILTGSTNTVNGNTLSCAGIGGTGASAGTTVFSLSGGTWNNTGIVGNPVTFAGNVTMSGSGLTFSGSALTYSSGTITTTSSTLLISGTTTLNTAGISWNNINFSGTNTITNNSLLTVTGILTFNASTAITFAGSSGWTAATVTVSAIAVAAQTLVNGVTYTITTAFNCFLSRNASAAAFTSDHASIRAILTLQQGATCNVLANFTRIDASAGRTIRTFNGTVTDCLNIVAFNDLPTVSKMFAQ